MFSNHNPLPFPSLPSSGSMLQGVLYARAVRDRVLPVVPSASNSPIHYLIGYHFNCSSCILHLLARLLAASIMQPNLPGWL